MSRFRFWERLLYDERGAALLWFLIVTPLLVLVLALSWESTELRKTTNWLQEGLNRSTKAAAWQATLPTYAVGTPSIDPVEAETAFRALLASNIRLDPVSLQPSVGNKRVGAPPEYELFIYNGPFPYEYANQEYGIRTIIHAPTAIALLKIKFGDVLIKQDITIRRWAKAEIYNSYTPLP